MSTNKIDEYSGREAKHLLNDICNALKIGSLARTPAVILANIENASRRSDCLSRIENHHTVTTLDEEGEESEDQLLNWGEGPEQYIETYKAVTTNTHDAMQDRIAELEQERDQLKTQNTELQEALTVNVMDWVYCGMLANDRHKEKWAMDQYKNLKRVVNKSPAACLTEIKAKAIEDFQTYFDKEYYGEELSQFVEQYAEKLRQQATS